ncbi:unnamed protein product [Symbiodinium sp. CCMP2592]|nr:unnamed protein product [Symbiodinium sp. CCMP2592]
MVEFEVRAVVVDPSTVETQMPMDIDEPSGRLPEDRRQAAQIPQTLEDMVLASQPIPADGDVVEAQRKVAAAAKAAAAEAKAKAGGAMPVQNWSATVLYLNMNSVTLLREAGVPVPEGFTGERKSFTVPAPEDSDDGTGSIGILWTTDQLYVNKALTNSAFDRSFNINKKGGVTISVRKLNTDWALAWATAKKLAKWPEQKERCPLPK